MTTSTHKCEVVQLDEFHEIPKADRIVRTDVFGGYPCVVSKKDAVPGSLWVYIPPDSLVSVDRKEFKFLDAPGNGVREDRKVRIKTRKYRKQQSMGLLIPAPKGAQVGDDLASHFGVEHYEPPVKGESMHAPKGNKFLKRILRRSALYGEPAPKLRAPYYDVDALRRHPDFFVGHRVVMTEKIHGSNVAYANEGRGFLHRIFKPHKDQSFRVRSRTVWKKPEETWYHCRAATDEVRALVKENPGLVLYGEVYGPGVQKGFDYGVEEPTFIAFDVYCQARGWLSWDALVGLCISYNIPHVPVLYEGDFDAEKAYELAEGKTTIGGDHVREGVVIQTHEENAPVRQLKCVGMGYYENS